MRNILYFTVNINKNYCEITAFPLISYATKTQRLSVIHSKLIFGPDTQRHL